MSAKLRPRFAPLSMANECRHAVGGVVFTWSYKWRVHDVGLRHPSLDRVRALQQHQLWPTTEFARVCAFIRGACSSPSHYALSGSPCRCHGSVLDDQEQTRGALGHRRGGGVPAAAATEAGKAELLRDDLGSTSTTNGVPRDAAADLDLPRPAWLCDCILRVWYRANGGEPRGWGRALAVGGDTRCQTCDASTGFCTTYSSTRSWAGRCTSSATGYGLAFDMMLVVLLWSGVL